MTVGNARERPDVSVIIVNFNGGRLVETAVDAVLRANLALEIFVCDNGSSDGSLQRLKHLALSKPNLEVVDNFRNIGFARANNISLELASGNLILLLNPDCIVSPGTIERMVDVMTDNTKTGLAGCLLRNPDGSEQAGCRRTLPTPWRSFVRISRLNRLFPRSRYFQSFVLSEEPLPASPTVVEAISGAFMLARRAAIQQVGLLDEGYFLHCEDVDWCVRFKKAGWDVLFVPDVDAVHHKGTCSKGREVSVSWHMHKGMVRFYRKFFRERYTTPVMFVVIAGVWARFILIAVKTLMKRAISRTDLAGQTDSQRNMVRLQSKASASKVIFNEAQDRPNLAISGLDEIGPIQDPVHKAHPAVIESIHKGRRRRRRVSNI